MNMTDKTELKNFRLDLEEALVELGKKYEVKITPKNINYNELSLNVKLLVERTDIDIQKIEFEKYCRLYEFEPEDYMKNVTVSGRLFKLIGFNTNKPKNNCRIIEVGTGKEYQINNKDLQ